MDPNPYESPQELSTQPARWSAPPWTIWFAVLLLGFIAVYAVGAFFAYEDAQTVRRIHERKIRELSNQPRPDY